ncbi:YEATS domain-containing protein 4 [Enteropsectra breve]|nr:YEATS domain-containing protein 4 [Enteropsectra breve]
MENLDHNTAPVIIGSEAIFIPEHEREFPELSHSWRIYVKAQPELIASVSFRLHESFANPVIVVNHAPFEVAERGWGEFTVQIKITLFNDEKIMTSHFLSLHANKYPHIVEKRDTILYRGREIEISPEYNYQYVNEAREERQINKAIEYMMERIEYLENNRY